jgi:bis(5'-nucleosidyl)-tetraphosphatase
LLIKFGDAQKFNNELCLLMLMPEETSAGVIVFYLENHIPHYLLLHYEEGHWDFPKGHVEIGEKLEETARRETHEETGMEITLNPGFKEHYSYFYKNKQDIVMNKTVYFFVGQALAKTVKLSFEHIGYGWYSYDNAFKKLTYENAKEVLKKAHNFLMQRKIVDF